MRLGNASGLRVDLVSPNAILNVGEDGFAITNTRSGVHFRPQLRGDRSISVDGHPLDAKKGFDIDSRPRRIEITDVDGSTRVILMKLLD